MSLIRHLWDDKDRENRCVSQRLKTKSSSSETRTRDHFNQPISGILAGSLK